MLICLGLTICDTAQEHAEDIASRPARSWFQSEHEKLRAAKVARTAATRPTATAAKAKGGKKRGAEEAPEGKSGKKGRGARDEGGDDGGGDDVAQAKPRARDDPMAVARRGAALAKGAAKRALAAGLRPAAAKEAGRQALRKDAKMARRKMMKEGGGVKKADSGGPGGLFAGDGINGARPGRDAPRSKAPRFDPKVAGAPRPLREGGAPKKSGFKSKKRYKRH